MHSCIQKISLCAKAQSIQSARLSFQSSDWVPQPPHPQGSVAPPPFDSKGGDPLAEGEGVERPIPTAEVQTLWYSVYTTVYNPSTCVSNFCGFFLVRTIRSWNKNILRIQHFCGCLGNWLHPPPPPPSANTAFPHICPSLFLSLILFSLCV